MIKFRESRQFKFSVVGIMFAAILIGAIVGYRLYRERERRASMPKEPEALLKILAFRGLLNREFLDRFETASGIHVDLTEAETPEDLWDKLEAPSSESGLGARTFDLVSLFSYQVPLAFQMTRLQPVVSSRLDWQSVSPDFRELPGGQGFHSVVPILWGLTGIVYDAKKISTPPTSWAECLKNPRFDGMIALPSSTVEIMRLLTRMQLDARDLKKSVQPIVSKVEFSSDTLSPRDLFEGPDQPMLASLSHGEGAFPPWTDSPERWKFVIPNEGSTLWILAFGLHTDMRNERPAYAFLEHLLKRESAEELVKIHHQASTSRHLESSTLDPRLRPSYLRQVPLNKINFWREFNRAREIRALLPKTDAE